MPLENGYLTDQKLPKGNLFQERTNTESSTILQKFRMNSLSSQIQYSSANYPFGDDDKPTALPQKPGSEVCKHRYKSAEQQLAESLRSYQEHSRSVRELQLEALKNAVALINTQVNDAKERVEKLQKLLADRPVLEPETYRDLQRQRWMEDKRRQVAEDLSKVLQHNLSPAALESHLNLTSLSQPKGISTPLDTTSSTPSLNANKDANLVRFFESSSRQRRSSRDRVRGRSSGPVTRSKTGQAKTSEDYPGSRRRKHHGLIPLTLKVSKPHPPFLHRLPSRNAVALTSSNVVSPDLSTCSQPSSCSAEEPSTPLSVSSLLSCNNDHAVLSAIPEVVDSKRFTTSIIAPVATLNRKETGTAIIWRNTLGSSTGFGDDLLADLTVPMPDYAVDLISSFESTVSLSIPSSFPLLPQSPISSPSPSSTPSAPPSSTTPWPSIHSPHVSELHKSTSRKRLSALFTVPEALSSRRGLSLNMNHRDYQEHRHSTSRPGRNNRFSTPPISSAVLAIPEEYVEPVSVSFSNVPVPGHIQESVNANDHKIMSRLKRRVSGLLRH